MTDLVAADLPAEPAGLRFRALVERGGTAQLPGAHNGMAGEAANALTCWSPPHTKAAFAWPVARSTTRSGLPSGRAAA